MGSDKASVTYDIHEVLVLGCDFVWAEFGSDIFAGGSVVGWSLMT